MTAQVYTHLVSYDDIPRAWQLSLYRGGKPFVRQYLICQKGDNSLGIVTLANLISVMSI
jgi:hypothetical protein